MRLPTHYTIRDLRISPVAPRADGGVTDVRSAGSPRQIGDRGMTTTEFVASEAHPTSKKMHETASSTRTSGRS
jgi:hypothetical protein